MITVNSIMLNEPFGFYALASLAPHVNEILLTDTGSSPEYLDTLEIATETFRNIKFRKEKYEAGGHEWKVVPNRELELHPNFVTLGPKLSALRQRQNDEAANDIVWLLDGDEVYPDKLAHYVANGFLPLLQDNQNLFSAHLPFTDFNSKTEIRQNHHMGRLFKRKHVQLVGDFPKDMFYAVYADGRKSCLNDGHINNITVDKSHGIVCHYEMLLKPTRKPYNKHAEYTGAHPEVFEQYRTGKFQLCYNLIQKYGF